MHSPALPIHSIHHVELIVGNAKQAAFFYRNAFGFDQIAYAGPETGVKDRVSYLMQQGHVRMVLTTPLYEDHPYSEHLKVHGDGVYDIAFLVSNADDTYTETLTRGAKSALEPYDLKDKKGSVRRAAVHTYGDTIHSMITKDDYEGLFLPGFEPEEKKGPNVGLTAIDHMVGNVEDGQMDTWVDWYQRVLGFRHFMTFDDKQIRTEYSALRSKVVANENNAIKFPINEPADGLKKSQIQEYVEFYNGAGCQHIALYTQNAIETVAQLRDQGVEFLEVPTSYYDELADRVGDVDEDIAQLKENRILVDRDDKGYLLQLFTKPVEDRPTLFFEVIQRRGAEGFGAGNFKALFEAIEREQAKRGNL